MPALSHHAPRGGFRNPWPDSEARGLTDVARWYFERNTTHRPPSDPDRSVFPVAEPRFGTAVSPGDLAITWIGHSSAAIEFARLTVLTDPVWSEYPSPVPIPSLRRWVPPPVALERIPSPGLVLISHNHYDHLDAPTVQALVRRHPGAEWITPLGVGPLPRRLGVPRVRELDWWDEVRSGGATVGCAPARHFSSRGPHDRNRTLWSGFSVRAGGRSIYFAGDTGPHPEFAAIGSRFGPFDVALLPVGAYEPRWFMRPVHLNPEDALLAFGALDAGAMLPIHWGTFKLTDEPMEEPPRRLRTAWAASQYAPDALWLLAHGETRRIPASAPRP